MNQDKNRWSGCCFKGCLCLLLFGTIACYFIYIKSIEFIRNFTAQGIELVVENSVNENLPKEESEKLVGIAKKFAEKIRKGEISLLQAAKVAVTISKSPVFYTFMARSFETRYITSSDLPPEEKKEARIIISRFSQGLIQEKIPSEKINEILQPLQEKTYKNGKEVTTFKQKVSREELLECLTKMKKLVDETKIVETEEFDLATELEKAIQKGLE